MNQFLHDLLLNLINLTIPILIPWIIGYLKELTSKVHLEKAQLTSKIMVKAAMQTIERPEEKAIAKNFIFKVLKNKFPKLEPDLVDSLIESAVLEVKKEMT